MKIRAWHPSTGETLFAGCRDGIPLGGFIIEATLPMPDGSEAVAQMQAPIELVSDDYAPPAPTPAHTAPDAP